MHRSQAIAISSTDNEVIIEGHLYWPPKEILLCYLVIVEVTFMLVRNIDIHIQVEFLNQE